MSDIYLEGTDVPLQGLLELQLFLSLLVESHQLKQAWKSFCVNYIGKKFSEEVITWFADAVALIEV